MLTRRRRDSEIEKRVEELVSGYRAGKTGGAPTAAQWREILSRPADAPITLLNFFKLRDVAKYQKGDVDDSAPVSGQDALARYSAVSGPALAKAGGQFLLVAPFEGTFIGEGEDWDFVAIGSYPNTGALLALFGDEDYRAAYPHRTAACARQRVIICNG